MQVSKSFFFFLTVQFCISACSITRAYIFCFFKCLDAFGTDHMTFNVFAEFIAIHADDLISDVVEIINEDDFNDVKKNCCWVCFFLNIV